LAPTPRLSAELCDEDRLENGEGRVVSCSAFVTEITAVMDRNICIPCRLTEPAAALGRRPPQVRLIAPAATGMPASWRRLPSEQETTPQHPNRRELASTAVRSAPPAPTVHDFVSKCRPAPVNVRVRSTSASKVCCVCVTSLFLSHTAAGPIGYPRRHDQFIKRPQV
jgi:hypothetical protein